MAEPDEQGFNGILSLPRDIPLIYDSNQSTKASLTRSVTAKGNRPPMLFRLRPIADTSSTKIWFLELDMENSPTRVMTLTGSQEFPASAELHVTIHELEASITMANTEPVSQHSHTTVDLDGALDDAGTYENMTYDSVSKEAAYSEEDERSMSLGHGQGTSGDVHDSLNHASHPPPVTTTTESGAHHVGYDGRRLLSDSSFQDQLESTAGTGAILEQMAMSSSIADKEQEDQHGDSTVSYAGAAATSDGPVLVETALSQGNKNSLLFRYHPEPSAVLDAGKHPALNDQARRMLIFDLAIKEFLVARYYSKYCNRSSTKFEPAENFSLTQGSLHIVKSREYC